MPKKSYRRKHRGGLNGSEIINNATTKISDLTGKVGDLFNKGISTASTSLTDATQKVENSSTGQWFGNFFNSLSSTKQKPVGMMGGKTKRKRGRRGGIGGPQLSWNSTAANFPSAAGPDGNNIYDLSKFNPYAPMTGGCMQKHHGNFSPADFDANGNSYLIGGKSRRHRKRRNHKKSKRRG